tara:strand:- start:656 stop:1837 length:1182 start_codon:yes stop_codon:yes gene_type:complete
MPDNFCIAPFIHLNNTPRGNIHPCCVWAGDRVGTMDKGILNAWTSDKMVALRNQFLDNERPPECSECWNIEDAGGTGSFRIRANTDFKKYMHLKKRLDTPVWLQLKLGAKCNLMCRTCSSGNSNQWLKSDAIAAYENIKSPKLQKKYKREYVINRQKQSSFIYDEKFWQELKELTPTLEYITFTGGEPLLIEEHYKYLEWCVQNDYAKNITLDYITNGTVGIDDHKKDLWSNFKKIEIIISMDGIEKLAEYTRTGLNWEEAKQNIFDYADYGRSTWGNHFGVTFLVNIFTIYYMEESIKFYKDNNIALNINFLHGPLWQNVRNLSNNIKQKVKETCSLPDEVIGFMEQEPTGEFNFCEQLKIQENIYHRASRKTLNYEKLFPEWWNILNEDSI